MAFATPDIAAIRDRILQDIVNLEPQADVTSDSDNFVRASAFAAAVEGLYQHQAWAARQILPDTQDPDFLERAAGLYGITRDAAVAATGTINFSGVVGSAVPLGTEVKNNAGIAFVTTAAGVIGGAGTAVIAAAAVVGGISGNLAAATALTLSSAPAGVDGAATIAAMSGGLDAESDASLLANLLTRLREPPQGGSKADYVNWALDVAGVTRAWCYPLRRGPNTVDVAIMAGAALPSGPLVIAAQAYVDTVRPVGADCLVTAPTAVNVAITAALTLSGTTLGEATTAINSALVSYFAALAPGDTVIVNRLRALIADTAGVVDFTLTVPGANVTTLADATHMQIPMLGTVTIS